MSLCAHCFHLNSELVLARLEQASDVSFSNRLEIELEWMSTANGLTHESTSAAHAYEPQLDVDWPTHNNFFTAPFVRAPSLQRAFQGTQASELGALDNYQQVSSSAISSFGKDDTTYAKTRDSAIPDDAPNEKQSIRTVGFMCDRAECSGRSFHRKNEWT